MYLTAERGQALIKAVYGVDNPCTVLRVIDKA
jgi:hypothetical protein